MRICGVCGVRYRAGGTLVFVGSTAKGRGPMQRVRACPACAGNAVRVVVAAPIRDPRTCIACKREPAQLGEHCVMEIRTKVAREARRRP